MRWLLVVCVIACGGKSTKSNDQMHKEHDAPLKAKVAEIEAAAAAGQGHASDPGVATVTGLDFDDVSHKDQVNAMAVLADEAKDPANDPKGPLQFQGSTDNDLRTVKAFLGVKVETNATKEWGWDEPDLKRFEHLKYVLVVYPTRTELAHKDGAESFTPGSVTSDAVLVELSTNKILGGFTTTAESSDEVMTKDLSGHEGEENYHQNMLDSDLSVQWGRAVTQGIEKRWPGVSVPWTVGTGI